MSRKKSFLKKTNYTFPSGKCNCGIIGHTTNLTARAPLVEAFGRPPLYVLAHAYTGTTLTLATKLCFAQLRIDIISDHVIAASAGQRERSRSGSVISHFLIFFVVFHFFDRFIVLLFRITNTPFHCSYRKHPR